MPGTFAESHEPPVARVPLEGTRPEESCFEPSASASTGVILRCLNLHEEIAVRLLMIEILHDPVLLREVSVGFA